MKRFEIIHWTPVIDGARSIMAIYAVPADKPSYTMWRRIVRETLNSGETVEYRRAESN